MTSAKRGYYNNNNVFCCAAKDNFFISNEYTEFRKFNKTAQSCSH